MDTKREEDGYVEFGWIATKDLKPHPDNAREHTEDQVKQIAKSIDSLGWGRPLTISLDNYVLIGHGALLAAEDELSLMSVPFRRVKYLHDTPEAVAIMDSDNRLAELSTWNYGKLETHFNTLKAEHFDVSLTGFEDEGITPLQSQLDNKDYSSTDYAKPEFDDLIDKYAEEGGKSDKNEQWFYIEFYKTPERYEELKELLQPYIIEGKHELDSNWFYNLIKGNE